MQLYYDRAGKPIDYAEYARLYEAGGNRVALDTVGPYEVSTVWLGIDHNFGMSGPPLIFESMVFSREEWHGHDGSGLHDLDCHRYATEAAALAGHAELVTLIRATTVDVETALEPGGTPAHGEAGKPATGHTEPCTDH